MEKVLLSIIIPTCNRLDTLSRAIDSLQFQNIPDIEIIIVDDSKRSLIEEISLLVSQTVPSSISVKIIRNDGTHSAARARNLGVSQADGEFITFLDDDDIYLPGRLHNMLNIAKEGKYSLVSSGRFFESGDFKVINNQANQKFGEIFIEDIKYLNDIDIGFMIKKTRFEELGGFNINLKSLEDWDFILRHLFSGNCYKIKRLDYAVNIEPGKIRVSNNDSESYFQLGELHKNRFGDDWFLFMKAHGLSLSNNLTLFDVAKCFSKGSIFKVMYCYGRQFKNRVNNYVTKLNFR
ncbi:glycosyltransferase family 2 protein [uncultured Shewanella sp.]|uniref:glycosyltransferase family 2 protein n=1 Tax=uncultured Shewanella sp. TaxID=173975 RepID=UPI002635EE65|nr:glycosyltransferase family 2 protein [uncultured Shewanella sp.]